MTASKSFARGEGGTRQSGLTSLRAGRGSSSLRSAQTSFRGFSAQGAGHTSGPEVLSPGAFEPGGGLVGRHAVSMNVGGGASGAGAPLTHHEAMPLSTGQNASPSGALSGGGSGTLRPPDIGGATPADLVPLDIVRSNVTVNGRGGPFILSVMQSGAVAIQSVDLTRSESQYLQSTFRQASGSSWQLGDLASFYQASALLHQNYPDASLRVALTVSGDAIGVFHSTGNPQQPYQIWKYPLNDSGKLRQLLVTGGTIGGETAVCFRLIGDGAGESRLIVTAFNDLVESGSFKSNCGN